MLFGRIDFLDARNYEGSRLSSTVLCAREDVTPRENNRNRLFLDRAWLLKAFFKDAHKQLALQIVVLKIVTLGCGDILQVDVEDKMRKKLKNDCSRPKHHRVHQQLNYTERAPPTYRCLHARVLLGSYALFLPVVVRLGLEPSARCGCCEGSHWRLDFVLLLISETHTSERCILRFSCASLCFF